MKACSGAFPGQVRAGPRQLAPVHASFTQAVSLQHPCLRYGSGAEKTVFKLQWIQNHRDTAFTVIFILFVFICDSAFLRMS